ncbi:MAG: hypothetical protein NTW49_00040 [Bacteroidia bacterium]|nr:hypothetical protein [Bacteroidia bacterium]
MKLIFRTLSLLFLCFAISSHFYASGQNAGKSSKVIPDPRLYECFDASFIQHQLDINPKLILYYNFFLDHSYYITDFPPKADYVCNFPVIDFAAGKDLSQLNVLKSNLKLNNKKQTYFQLGDRHQIIVFYTQKELTQKFNEYLVSIGYLKPRNK